MSQVEYFDRQFYRWKVEGQVATMQMALEGAEKTCIEHYRAETNESRINRIEKAREKGIKIIEFWVSKDGIDIVKKTWEGLSKKLALKFEIVTEEERTFLCQLLL